MTSWWIKHIIKKATNNIFKTLWIGFFATILLQWSSAVLLILESFVSAGMMQFSHAARVIMWCNIWSSAIWVILWSLWLEFDLAAYALPIMWVLALMLLIIKSDKVRNILKIAIGLCLIFVWLGYMNDGMAFVANTVDFAKLSTHSIFLFYLVWLLGTIIMQSSAITIALVLSAASVWIVDYRMWIMLLLGCFLWTTSTPALGCIKWWYLKKQVAGLQVIFNAVLSVIWTVTLPFWVRLMNKISPDPVVGLSIFALLFKTVFVFAMLPFLNKFVWFVQRLFPKKAMIYDLHIEDTSPTVISAWLEALSLDLSMLLQRVLKHILNTWSVDETELKNKKFNIKHLLKYDKQYANEDLKVQYDEIKEIAQRMFIFLSNLKSNTDKTSDIILIDQYHHSLACMLRTVKYIKDVHKTIAELKESDDKYLTYVYNEFKLFIISLYKDIEQIHDKKSAKEFSWHIKSLLSNIKSIVDKDFLNSFANNPDIEKFDSTVLSDMLSISHNFYEACFYLVLSIKDLYGVKELEVD